MELSLESLNVVALNAMPLDELVTIHKIIGTLIAARGGVVTDAVADQPASGSQPDEGFGEPTETTEAGAELREEGCFVPGDRVLIRTAGAGLYSGTVFEAQGDLIIVDTDDGDRRRVAKGLCSPESYNERRKDDGTTA